ncbi:replication-relaxation family protein [Actinokineospora guangxiensis]|uniref:Replication-relaxation family protein n=1 Tax=Actinokineospora guangxiensis TaxID=1490288 RepID=A0ABW0EQ17_9PSEU
MIDSPTLHVSLNARDRAVLTSLEQARLLTMAHVQRLHVTDGSPLSNVQRTQALLRRLHQLGLVQRVARLHGDRQVGSRGTVYGLSHLGLAVLFAPAAPPRPARRLWARRPFFHLHLLAVSDLYVALREQAAVDVLEFQPEPRCWRTFTLAGELRTQLRPDALVRLAKGHRTNRWFVEVDRGTEGLGVIRRKCQRYLSYEHTGLEQVEHHAFPQVLWLVPSQQRAAQVKQVVDQLQPQMAPVFVVSRLQDISDAL